MSWIDKVKSYMSFDEDDDDSLYEEEMRELERKERAKNSRRPKIEEDDEYEEEKPVRRRSTASSVERRTSDSAKSAGQLAQERRRSNSSSAGRTYERTRMTPPRSPENSYVPRNNGNNFSSRRNGDDNVVKMKREASDISIIKVQSFADAQEVCDSLIDGRPIIVSFDDPRSNEAQRIMDFIAGCIYVINGNLHTISDSIFLFSPKGVDVSGDYLNMMQNNGFGIPTFNKMI